MSLPVSSLLAAVRTGDFRSLARAITVVENDLPEAASLLRHLQHTAAARVVGITGPPGAGKSTLVNGLLRHWVAQGRRVAVLAVDPTSPFNFGALLGDRIRMSEFYSHPQVYIRSLASRGALGGLHPRMLEVADVVKEAGFDLVLVETVGVGQSEVEVAGLADCTVVVLVPEAGDEVQTMKSGVLEIADVFAVNKGDRPEADAMVKRLRALAHERSTATTEIPVLKTAAATGDGVPALAAAIEQALEQPEHRPERHLQLLVEKVIQLVLASRTRDLSRSRIRQALEHALQEPAFNLYEFAASWSEHLAPTP